MTATRCQVDVGEPSNQKRRWMKWGRRKSQVAPAIRKGARVRLSQTNSGLVRTGATGTVLARYTNRRWGRRVDVQWDNRSDLSYRQRWTEVPITTVLLDHGDTLEVVS
jgi:hypothetical protein